MHMLQHWILWALTYWCVQLEHGRVLSAEWQHWGSDGATSEPIVCAWRVCQVGSLLHPLVPHSPPPPPSSDTASLDNLLSWAPSSPPSATLTPRPPLLTQCLDNLLSWAPSSPPSATLSPRPRCLTQCLLTTCWAEPLLHPLVPHSPPAPVVWHSVSWRPAELSPFFTL